MIMIYSVGPVLLILRIAYEPRAVLDEDFYTKYSELISDMPRLDFQRSYLLWPSMFLLRRVAVAAAIIALRDNLALQLVVFYAFTFTQVGILYGV